MHSVAIREGNKSVSTKIEKGMIFPYSCQYANLLDDSAVSLQLLTAMFSFSVRRSQKIPKHTSFSSICRYLITENGLKLLR